MYFSSTFEVIMNIEYEGLPLWLNEILPFPSEENLEESFDISPITSGPVKFFLK